MADDAPLPTYQPTPTQAENDAAANGEHVMDKEVDGSPEMPQPAPVVPPPPPEATPKTKTVEAATTTERGAYKTRTMRAVEGSSAPSQSSPPASFNE